MLKYDESWKHYAKLNVTQKDKAAWFYLYEITRIVKFIEPESRRWLPEAVGSYCLMGTEFLLGWWKSASNGYGWWLYNTVNVLNTTEFYI